MRSASLLTAASCAALGAATLTFPSEPSWPGDGNDCTDESLSIPSWLVTDYNVDAAGKHHFGVENRASGNGAAVDCTPGGACIVENNSALSASLDTSGPNPIVSLKARWMCSDKGTVLNFEATGSAVIFSLKPAASGGLESPLYWYLAQGTLTKPVPLHPVQPTPPQGFDLATCGDTTSSTPAWTVKDFTYQNYTKPQCKVPYEDIACLDPGDNGKFPHYRGEYINVTITNERIDYTVLCDFEPSLGNEHPSNPLRCTGGGFNQIGVEISWTLNLPTSIDLTVQNLWFCLEDPTENVYPHGYIASGSVELDVNCTTTTGISGTADDIVTICTRSDPNSVSISSASRQQYGAFSLVTAPFTSGGCTFDSLVDPQFRFEDPQWRTRYDNTTNSTVLKQYDVKLGNPATNTWLGYDSGSPDPATWYPCNLGSASPWHCAFQYDISDITLTVNQTWACSDKNSNTPLYYSAQLTTPMPEEGLFCGGPANDYACSYQGIYVFYRPISGVTISTIEPPRK